MTLARTRSLATPHDRWTRVLETLEARPEGMTARELAVSLGMHIWTIRTVLDGLFARRLVGRQSFRRVSGTAWRWKSARHIDDGWPPAWCVCPDYPSIPYVVTRGLLAACNAYKSAPCALCTEMTSPGTATGVGMTERPA